MKKIKYLIMITLLISLTGCLKNDTMEDIEISTSIYPVEYVVSTLYGEHSTINSIYPKDSEIIDFKVTDVLLSQYSDTDLFIFNGLSDEKNYVKKMLKNNKNLKIIDVTSNMNINYSDEELWLDPNNLLTIAYNIKNGFNEYIKSSYLIDEINNNYEELKTKLTSLDGKYYSTVKNSTNNTIIVNDDAFTFLRKYGLKVISLDKDTVKEKDIIEAKELLDNGTCNYVFIKYKQNKEDIVENVLSSTTKTLELYTMTNLSEIDVEKNNYVNLMNENLETIKQELFD